MHITDEMIEYYHDRTHLHCKRVNDNLRKVYESLKQVRPVNVKGHDASKFYESEFAAYVVLTWQKNVDPDYVCEDVDIDAAILHHFKHNSHHPEYHDSNYTKGRPSDINAFKMPEVDIIEMVCDWHAMSQELGGSTRTFFESNNKSRWQFSTSQEELILQLLDILEPTC